MVPGVTRERLLGWCRAADAGPWSSLAIGERINFPNPAAMTALATAAAVTERVRLMTYVLILPMHAEVMLAKEIATIDQLCEGRLTIGLGAGARPDDYAAAGQPFTKKRLSRLRDQVATMKRVWSGELIVEGAQRPVEPAPYQPGGPPLLAAALSDKAIHHVSTWADGLAGFSFGPDPKDVERVFETARRAWAQNQRPAPRLVGSFWFALGPKARNQLDRYLHRYLNFFGKEAATQLAKTVTTDSPKKLQQAIRFHEDLGANEISLVPTTWDLEELDRLQQSLP